MINQRVVTVDKKDRLQIIILRWIMLASFWACTAYIAYTAGYSQGIEKVLSSVKDDKYKCSVVDEQGYDTGFGRCIDDDEIKNLVVDKY